MNENLIKVSRVFFHELGHLVANNLNMKHFGGYGVEKIIIKPCGNHPGEYCGELFPILPDGRTHTDGIHVPKSKLAQYLAGLMYGCIFQSYHQQSCLKQCLDSNGCEDITEYSGALSKHGIGYTNDSIYSIIEQHFRTLMQQNTLDAFMDLNPETFLEIDPNHEAPTTYSVKMDLLISAIQPFIDILKPIYVSLIQELEKIISEAIPWTPPNSNNA